MSKLEKNLKQWQAQGFISEEQARKIQAYEENKPESSWILSGLLILGAVTIGIGIISLIAANWEEIPETLKLFCDFSLLIGLAAATFKSFEKNKLVVFEILLLSYMILCLASIGLISQVYHTGGNLHQALLLWTITTAATALCARQIFAPLVWVGTFLFSLVMTGLDSPLLKPLFHENYQALFMMLPLICASFAFLFRKVSADSAATRAFRAWSLMSAVVALGTAEVNKILLPNSLELKSYVPAALFALLASIGIWLSPDYRKTQRILLLTILVTFLVPFILPIFEVESSSAYAIFSILVLGMISVFLASLQMRRLFQAFLFLVGLRFLVLYFQALGGLATTGLGLIISGVLVIAMAALWNKHRSQLANWAERSMQ